MLQPAHVGHLALLRALIREGAAEGSFDRGLAAESDEAADFFDKLKRALVTGYFVEQDPRSGRIETVAVPGYVFWPDDRHSGLPPIGFGLSYEQAWPLILHWNNRCDPPWSEREIAHKLSDALKKR